MLTHVFNVLAGAIILFGAVIWFLVKTVQHLKLLTTHPIVTVKLIVSDGGLALILMAIGGYISGNSEPATGLLIPGIILFTATKGYDIYQNQKAQHTSAPTPQQPQRAGTQNRPYTAPDPSIFSSVSFGARRQNEPGSGTTSPADTRTYPTGNPAIAEGDGNVTVESVEVDGD